MEKPKQKIKLGELLMGAGMLTQAQLEEVLAEQGKSRKRMGQILIERNILTEEEIMDTLAVQLSLERFDIGKAFIDPEVARCIPKEVAKKYNLIPFGEKDGKLQVAMSDPLNIFAIDDISFITQKPIQPCIAGFEAIEKAIELYFSKQSTDKALEDLKKEYKVELDGKYDQAIIDEVQSAPAVRLTNSIVNQAITSGASDIHIEPFEKEVKVRYRIDGVLVASMAIPKSLYSSVCTRIKIMAGMNIAENRIPQDGRNEMEVGGRSYDFRVSSLPTVFGEKIVIRILDGKNFDLNRSMIGFTNHDNAILNRILSMPYGIVLLTGPTGSGKSTTLYTILKEFNTVDKNIVTVEDPVEYTLLGINQVQVNSKAGLTFASSLRSILRQDPDIIMIGEMRDEETAHIAVRAAITGHLVFSTLHTNDAPTSLTRLVDMGIAPYLVAESTIGIISQRLLRKLCPSCKRGYLADDREKKILRDLNVVKLYKPTGCPACNNTGYKGRIAIHEVLYLDSKMRSIIEKGANADELRTLAVKNGMVPLYENCKRLVINGVTSINEMVRTVYARD
ncbi:GspE/PulE family protein [Desulfosporosinus meridiei]|uniref:Type II secretory pathway, ATPase PulE/Tfp pilus assembly pathway, ATPase PilB n=1 Tax=Desulfosporosinus meridiei (strain ATCC BAA-275 / DSM 13257 / KCTC 12902 / NCIMB 13706 / S10) TaxID=768704 RepID=J7IV59_DESMD|nr:ATPase, T2SS/T4P/T4SS family [Desulfosporosinus meridiei]AFQ42998.1 type II secretory pathway, ATPase PulE/Tfp pilus assembly pathway, ATPase PilB [Desulfosporosinus meridiei DSM 13257]